MSESITQPVDILNTTLLMTASAAVMGVLGVVAMLFPEELLALLGTSLDSSAALPIKLLGTAYVGYAVLNWMAREKLIGGIYSRPVALGNFAHFFIAATVLIKQLTVAAHPRVLSVGAVVFAALAVSFGSVVFAGGESCGCHGPPRPSHYHRIPPTCQCLIPLPLLHRPPNRAPTSGHLLESGRDSSGGF